VLLWQVKLVSFRVWRVPGGRARPAKLENPPPRPLKPPPNRPMRCCETRQTRKLTNAPRPQPHSCCRPACAGPRIGRVPAGSGFGQGRGELRGVAAAGGCPLHAVAAARARDAAGLRCLPRAWLGRFRGRAFYAVRFGSDRGSGSAKSAFFPGNGQETLTFRALGGIRAFYAWPKGQDAKITVS